LSTLPDHRQLDRLELTALAYLLAPMGLFLWGWWRWPVALIASGLLVLTGHSVLRQRRRESAQFDARIWFVLAVVALLWVGASGLLGALPLNRDWSIRMVVLRDLTLGNWPVSYGDLQGGESVLRFSMGYYLVPAALGGWLGGVGAARALLGLWTVLGVLLFFALAVQSWPRRQTGTVAGLLALLMLFSGMDIVGFLLGRAHVPQLGDHIEWWTPWLQYSSQTTLLFWAPNHALPAWLGALLVWRHRLAGLATAPAALFVTAAALWSPLACLGLLPLFTLSALRGGALRLMKELASGPVLAMLPVLGLIGVFVTFGIVREVLPTESRALATVAGVSANWHEWIVFELLEWGLLACTLVAAGPRRLGWEFWASCLLLLVLPLLRFGPGNDLVMRGGIAPLTLLMLCVGKSLGEATLPARWRMATLVVLLIGTATPFQEFWRQTQKGSRWPDDGSSMADYHSQAWHYVGSLRPGWLAMALRPPHPLP